MDWRRISWPILITLGVIILLGILFLRSAAYHAGTDSYRPYAEVQVTRIAFGFVCFFIAVLIPYDRIGRHAAVLYVTGLALLLAVFVVGREANGSSRWIPLGFIDLQPSEVMKLALIVALARALRFRDRIQEWRGLLVPFALTFIPMALILKQPDLGTALIFLPILFVMLFAAGARIRHLALVAGLGLAACPLVYFFGMKDYQRARITAFINPEDSAMGAGYQVLQSLTAVGSGGLAGKGWGQGTQTHLQFLPERHTDFIFAVIAEEWGFLGAGGLLLLFFILFALSLSIAARTREPTGRLMVIGAVTVLATQVAINTAMTVGLMPITGLTLPFVSFGGSSLVVSLVTMGLILNVGMRPIPTLASDGFARDPYLATISL
ncbi:MAG: rod shape-determining protein RodA [Planctomycetota bacterium]|nr:rod shape-determining protein RodA [Planctomycetota bacterium]